MKNKNRYYGDWIIKGTSPDGDSGYFNFSLDCLVTDKEQGTGYDSDSSANEAINTLAQQPEFRGYGFKPELDK